MTEDLRKTIESLPAESNTELHCHSDAYANVGIGDGAQSVTELVNVAIEKDAVACTITDHGNCVNWLDFYNYCNGDETSDHKQLPKGTSIKPILGVEAYVTTEGYYDINSGNPETDVLVSEVFKGKEIPQHLVLIAKNYKGMKQIARYVSATNRNIDDKGRPIGTERLLYECFGPDAVDSGNVVAMSACIGGVLATPLAFNNKIDHEIEKIEKRIEKSKSLLPAEYFAAREKVAKVNIRIDELNAEVEALAEKAGKKFKETKANIKAEPDEMIRKYLEEKLALEMAETKDAKERIAELKKQIQELKTTISEDKKLLTKHKPKAQTIESNLDKIDALNSVKKSESKMLMETTDAIKLYESIFGTNNFYAEVQYHGDALEAELYPKIAKLARANGIKLVATNDNHMARPEDLKKRMLLKNCTRIKTGQWSGPIESDSELYYKTALEKAEMLSQILPDDMVIESISNIIEIVSNCNARLPETKVNLEKGITEEMVKPNQHYPEFKDADAKLRELTINGFVTVETMDGKVIEIACPEAGIEMRYDSKWNNKLQKRLDYELETIRNMGFASYHLFIADVLGKCKAARENAMDIGPGRGSAAGSLVCYLAGITELDPIDLDLLFERFLNPERVSMPKLYSGIQCELYYSEV